MTSSFFEMSRLGQSRSASYNPVGDPIEHLADADLRFAEQREGLGAVAEEGVIRFGTFERHGLAQPCRELLGNFPDMERFGAGDVQNIGRSRGMRERFKAHRRGIARLPEKRK